MVSPRACKGTERIRYPVNSPHPVNHEEHEGNEGHTKFFEGRKGHARSKVPLEGVTEFKDIHPSECPHCGGDEFILDPIHTEKRQVTELPEIQLHVIHATQVPIAVHYKEVKIHGQVLDMVVEEKVILELKSVEILLPIHEAQIISYLKSTGLTAGLLINFKERLVKDGIKRFIWTNNY